MARQSIRKSNNILKINELPTRHDKMTKTTKQETLKK